MIDMCSFAFFGEVQFTVDLGWAIQNTKSEEFAIQNNKSDGALHAPPDEALGKTDC